MRKEESFAIEIEKKSDRVSSAWECKDVKI